MLNTYHPQIPQNIFHQSGESRKKQQMPRDVWQDKIAASRDRVATDQLAVPVQTVRPQQGSTDTHRVQNQTDIRDRTEPLTLHVKPIVKDRLRQIAREEGLKNPHQEPLSMSKVGGGYLERGLQEDMDMHYGALLEPVIRQILQKEMQEFRNQLRWLLVRIAYDANQTRSLVTNIFYRQPGLSKEARNNILVETSRAAKTNIFGKSPQMAELLNLLDQEMGAREKAAA